MIRLQLQQRLDESLASAIPDVDDRARVVETIIDRYHAPTSRCASWRTSEWTRHTEPGQPRVAVVGRGDDPDQEVYVDDTADHVARLARAQAVADGLNAIDADLFGTAGGTAG